MITPKFSIYVFKLFACLMLTPETQKGQEINLIQEKEIVLYSYADYVIVIYWTYLQALKQHTPAKKEQFSFFLIFLYAS